MAERLSLKFLGYLCEQIKKHYPPGAQIILCSDGRVFNDIIGIRNEDVTAYQNEISRLIDELSLTSITIFNLDGIYAGSSFDEMRQLLLEQFGDSIDAIKVSVRLGSKNSNNLEHEEAHRLYCGMTRFLFEDSLVPNAKQSRTTLQKESRAKAYEVIQRSAAWGKLISKQFPNSVRLSIHPQTCGAKKLGIHLMEGESWMTPWHGVAVDVGGRFVLLKRWHAEKLGARLVTHTDGSPSHYVLDDKHSNKQGLTVLNGGQNKGQKTNSK